MLRLRSLLDGKSSDPVQAIPAGRIDRMRQSSRRRLADAVEEVFHRACVENDLRTAAGLYAILDDIHTRRVKKFGTAERRISDELLTKARDELERCRELNRREAPPAD
jgi:hypothetical protein